MLSETSTTGGGLIRSSGGFRRIKIHFKSDERILGDSDFVDKVLKTADEALEHKYQLKTQGYDLNALAGRVAEVISIKPEEIFQYREAADKSQDKKPFLPPGSPRAWVYNDGASPKAQNFPTCSQYKCSAWCAHRREKRIFADT